MPTPEAGHPVPRNGSIDDLIGQEVAVHTRFPNEQKTYAIVGTVTDTDGSLIRLVNWTTGTVRWGPFRQGKWINLASPYVVSLDERGAPLNGRR